MDSLIASYQAGVKEDTDAVREVQRVVEETLAAAADRERQVQQVVKGALPLAREPEGAVVGAGGQQAVRCVGNHSQLYSARPAAHPRRRANHHLQGLSRCSAALSLSRIPALSSRISRLEVAADYTEAKATHDKEVAALNDVIKSSQAELTRIAEDPR